MKVIPISTDYWPICESCANRGDEDVCEYCDEASLYEECDEEFEDRLAA